jgi:hypothetical protein
MAGVEALARSSFVIRNSSFVTFFTMRLPALAGNITRSADSTMAMRRTVRPSPSTTG